MIRLRRTAAAFIVVSAFGCAAATQRAYIAPTDETITTSTEERTANPPTHLIYVANHSTVGVTVFSVSLRNCENIKLRCEPRPMNLHIDPGSRVLALRVEPANPEHAYSYNFGFSWHADSGGMAAVAALAGTGEKNARQTLAAIQHQDSVRRAETGPHYNELTREAFAAIAPRAARLTTEPESLVMAPGERISFERIRLLVSDKQGTVLGQTRWMRWSVPGQGIVQMVAPSDLVARQTGRAVIRLQLADEAQGMLGAPLGEVQVPVVVAYKTDAHAPLFLGRAIDADSKTPLQCTPVALEDSAQNIVARDRTGHTGSFALQSPRSGTYRIRVETRGWAPVYGAPTVANPDETKQGEYAVRFSERLLMSRELDAGDFQHAQPVAVATEPVSTRPAGRGAAAAKAPATAVQSVTIGGSDPSPVLGIVANVAPMTTWLQFVVDSTGHVDSTAVQLPAETPASARAAVMSVLPRVRFSPALNVGAPTCEMLRMQVDFRGR